MTIQFIGSFDKDQVYCAGSFTKMLTTFVSLSLLSEHYELTHILDDNLFLDKICDNPSANDFLRLFQKHIGSPFTLRDICSYYAGLPYTFDLSEKELENVEKGQPFKHHQVPDEKTFLYLCENKITPVYANRCKFHYSELSIIFLGYLIEKIYHKKMEDLFQQYVIDPFKLKNSVFSRKRVEGVYCQDLSDRYDYPSIAIVDHGYFCYSNGYYTTLNDMKLLIENIVNNPVFNVMIDITQARAASNRLLNGLTIEIRLVNDDVLIGYEGLSFSGCNLWMYSLKNKQGYIAFSNDEETIYDAVYGQAGYTVFDTVPDYTQKDYIHFRNTYQAAYTTQHIPPEFQGNYLRVNINEKNLPDIFRVSDHSMMIRNPDEIEYDIIHLNNNYRILNKDHVHGAKVGFYTARSHHHYMCYDGTLYKKIE